MLFFTDELWFAEETRRSLTCPVEPERWYFNGNVIANDASQFTISRSGTLWINNITFSLNNSLFACEGSSGDHGFQYRITVEGALLISNMYSLNITMGHTCM